jgi:cysteine synthase B
MVIRAPKRTSTSDVFSPDSGVWSHIGNTPLLPLNDLMPEFTQGLMLYGKAEWYNPAGSVKDRPAAKILQMAIESGYLHEGNIFLDSTSGNMGIAYATLGAALGIPVHLVIPENAGPERLGRLKALGAELTLTDPLEGSDGAHKVASDMAAAESDHYYFADQYNNDANWQAHYEGTGPEIWAQTKGEVTHFIAGMGTTGTITGASKYLKDKNPNIRVFAVQPDGPLHGLEGLKHIASSPTPGIYNERVVDETIEVSTEDTYHLLRDLARNHGFLLGISSGAALVAARKLSEKGENGTFVMILPDSGVKYLSQPFWSGS